MQLAGWQDPDLVEVAVYGCALPEYRSCGSIEDVDACIRGIEFAWGVCLAGTELTRVVAHGRRREDVTRGFTCGVRAMMDPARRERAACREIADYLLLLDNPTLGDELCQGSCRR